MVRVDERKLTGGMERERLDSNALLCYNNFNKWRNAMSKTILNHPAVEELSDCSDSEYRYHVILKDGWVWGHGRNEGCQGMRFNSVKEFQSQAIENHNANP